jgi:hypothetical protein
MGDLGEDVGEVVEGSMVAVREWHEGGGRRRVEKSVDEVTGSSCG